MEDYIAKQSTQATTTVSETERLLSKLGHGYKKAKAHQILRLLKDQEALNKRFKDCALAEDDEEGDATKAGPLNEETLCNDAETPDSRKEPYGDDGGDPISGAKKLIPHIDPSRCRTSMGFYNEAECSGSVDGNKNEVDDLQAETDAAMMEERKAVLGPLVDNSRLIGQGRRRLFRLQLDENDATMEDNAVQSARSSRPKTGIATSSAKGKQYRRPCQMDPRQRDNKKGHAISTSVSKLEGPMTPRGSFRGFCDNPSMPKDDYGCLVSTPRNISFQPLTPRYNELNGNCTPRREESSFCPTPRPSDPILYNRLQHDLALCFSPRKNEASLPLTPRHNDWGNLQTPRQNELSMISPRPRNPQRNAYGNYNGQLTPREDAQQNQPSPQMEDLPTSLTPRSHTRKYAALRSVNVTSVPHEMKTVTIVEKTSDHTKAMKKYEQAISSKSQNNSLADRGLAIGVRMPTTPRSVITVDQSPVHTMQGVPENGEVVTPRRQKHDPSFNKSKNTSSLHRSGVHQNLNKLPERVHPISMMKLPPLEVTLNKPVIS